MTDDGGSLFKHDIVNRILDQSLKRNLEEELWYIIEIYNSHDESINTTTNSFRWSEQDHCWMIRHINRIGSGFGAGRTWIFEKQYLMMNDLKHYLRVQYELFLMELRHDSDTEEINEDGDYTVTLNAEISFLPTTPSLDGNFKSEQIEIYRKDYMRLDRIPELLLILVDYTKCGFRSVKSFKKNKIV